ncbi:hypothetical protein CALCODRAFT_369665 [Calocera cornea HHB12733]|uniref:Uncharacterized protein n=1 Tax=Calocera cornea HHB12733 TaxID=1353952 RepID=A0A165EI43_9BASI|nr:hypothetical protein CALCODRAFT_369665 [Calocera cornea HHB12733]
MKRHMNRRGSFQSNLTAFGLLRHCNPQRPVHCIQRVGYPWSRSSPPSCSSIVLQDPRGTRTCSRPLTTPVTNGTFVGLVVTSLSTKQNWGTDSLNLHSGLHRCN